MSLQPYTIYGGRYDGLVIHLHPVEAIGQTQAVRAITLEQKSGCWPTFAASFGWPKGQVNGDLMAIVEADPVERTATFVGFKECSL